MSPPLSSLELLHPELQDKLGVLMQAVQADGLPMMVYETIRSPGRQAQLYTIGRTPGAAHFGRTVTRAQPWQSPHQYGLAADVVFQVAGRPTWDEPRKGQWDHFTILAHKAGLVTLSFEKPHVQLPGFHPDLLPKGPQRTEEWLEWLRERLHQG